ncbi:MAG: DNA polymerase III subunit delta [Nitrospirae bacterium]|jgi:DNA polymerase-3 subunit delta|nr:DNA polymerase III subunit delta [Nitrospirota bacterium]
MSYQALLNEIEKGLPSEVYLFYSSDSFLIREAIEVIKKIVPENDRDFNFHVFNLSDEEVPSIQQILDVTNTFCFFGSRRFTLLSGNLLKISKKDFEKLHNYILSPAPSSVLILLHNGVAKKDALEKFGVKKLISLDIKEPDIPEWIKKRIKMKGLEITDDAVSCLIASSGTDLGLLASEIEKISMLGKKKITFNDISDILAGGRLYNVFDLVYAISAKNPDKVFKIYKNLKETIDDYSLIGALNWQYGRSFLSKRNREGSSHLLKIFELLNKVDIDIKSSGRNFPIEYLLIKLLQLQGDQVSVK